MYYTRAMFAPDINRDECGTFALQVLLFNWW